MTALSGRPERHGQVLHQAGAVATALYDDDGELFWKVRRTRDGFVRYTNSLAHIGHWKPAP